MSPRMPNPSLVVPGALPPLLELTKAISQVGLPKRTIDLVRLLVSRLNGRAIHIPGEPGDADEPLRSVADWRDSPAFSAPERAALGLAEAATCLRDNADPVPEDVWAEAARHYDQAQLGALLLQIGLVNLWNRVNVATREEPAEWS